MTSESDKACRRLAEVAVKAAGEALSADAADGWELALAEREVAAALRPSVGPLVEVAEDQASLECACRYKNGGKCAPCLAVAALACLEGRTDD